MGTSTATIETLTAEVRVLMVGSRQVTLSVYRQLDHCLPDQVQPFGRVSDKHDESNSEHGCPRVFIVGCDITTGALVRSKYFVGFRPERNKKLVQRRDTENRRSYGDDPRQSVKPFAEERRNEDRRQKHSRRALPAGGVWMWAESTDEYEERLSAWQEAGSRYKEWTDLPLIVLAGLR